MSVFCHQVFVDWHYHSMHISPKDIRNSIADFRLYIKKINDLMGDC